MVLTNGYARAMIVRLLETAVTYHQREHEINLYGKSSLTALNEWAAYPVGMRDRMLEENKTALDAVMNHPRLRDLFGKSSHWTKVAMLDWEPGSSKSKLSSHVVMTEAAGFTHLGDFLPARFPGSTDIEKIFDDNYGNDELVDGCIKCIGYLEALVELSIRCKYVFALFNFYPKLFTWVQLHKLLLAKGFVEETHVFHNPRNKSYLPSELVLFRCGTILLGVVKSWSSAADSSGRITNEQCEQCGQTIDFVTDLGNALEGRCTGSFGAIEAAIAKVLSDENFHQNGLVGAALSREMVTPNDVNAFALSDLKWSAVFFHGARGGLRSASPNFLTWTVDIYLHSFEG